MPIQPLREQERQEEKPLLVSVSWRQHSRAQSTGLAPATSRCSRRIRVARATQDALNSPFLCNTTLLEWRWVTSRNRRKMPPQKAAPCCSCPEHLQIWPRREPFRNQGSSLQISNTWCHTVPWGSHTLQDSGREGAWPEARAVGFWQHVWPGRSHATPAFDQWKPVRPVSERSWGLS